MRILSNKAVAEAEIIKQDHESLLERMELINNAIGVGLWEAYMPEGDAAGVQLAAAWTRATPP